MHYWADLQSVHGLCCCDNIAPNAKCQQLLVLALCLVVAVVVVMLAHSFLFVWPIFSALFCTVLSLLYTFQEVAHVGQWVCPG